MFEIISWLVLVLVFSLIHIKMSRKRKQRENGKLTIGEKQKILTLVDELKQKDPKMSLRKLSDKVSPVMKRSISKTTIANLLKGRDEIMRTTYTKAVRL